MQLVECLVDVRVFVKISEELESSKNIFVMVRASQLMVVMVMVTMGSKDSFGGDRKRECAPYAGVQSDCCFKFLRIIPLSAARRLTFAARGVTSVGPKTWRTVLLVGRRVIAVSTSMAPGTPAPIAKSLLGSNATMPSSTPSPCTSASLLMVMTCASELSLRDWPASVLISETMVTAWQVSGEVWGHFGELSVASWVGPCQGHHQHRPRFPSLGAKHRGK